MIFTKEYFQAISKQKEVFILIIITSKKPNLDQSKYDMAAIITILQEERFCNQCDILCWPTNKGHIKLTDTYYTIWAHSI
ncbi:19783_t:CDS:2, partial [Racocetra persica]